MPETTPPLSTLPVDDLARPLVVAVPSDEALRHLVVAGGHYTILVAGEQTTGRYSLIDMRVPPGGGPPFHRHDFEEAFMLLEGALTFRFRDATQTVQAPATVAIPANAPHSFRNDSDTPAHMLCLCTPAGQEEFFALVGVPVAGPEAPPPVLTEAEQADKRDLATALAARFKTEFPPP